MSTQKWSDDELDDLFRNSSEATDPTYDPVAWQDLQTRLNARDRTRLRTKLLRLGLPVLLLLVATGSIIWYTRSPGVSPSTIAVAVPERVKPVESESSSPIPAGSGSTTSQRTRAAGSPAAGNQPANRGQLSTAGRPTDLPAGESGTSQQRKDGLTAGQPVGAAPSSGKRTLADWETKKRTGSQSLTSSTGQPFSDEAIQRAQLPEHEADLTSEVNRPRRKTEHTTGPVVVNPATAPVVADRLSRRADRSATRDVQPILRSDYQHKRILVTGHRSSHLTSTARQDAKLGGLGHQRSVVSGLVHPTAIRPTAFRGVSRATDAPPALPDTSMNQDGQLTTVDRRALPPAETLPGKATKWPIWLSSPLEPVLPENPASGSHPAHFRLPGVSVQLVLSPDLSSVGLNNFDRPGSTIGLLFQYRLTDRFSIQTGALWSTKRYISQSNEYTIPGYLHILPESIAGKCTMLDLPLNLRYDVLLRPGGVRRGPARWFVSGGFTSYFIDHEAYTFNYANPADPVVKSQSQGWDNKAAMRKGGSFGLSNLNISVGYERPLSQRLSWQIEPFMKVPLQPIGYFKVKLLSTGAFLSLRYRL